MKITRRNIFSLTALAALALATLLGGALAQQQQHVSFKTLAENSKLTQGLNVTIGDVPNHILRIFEVHRTFPNDPPVINGIKLVEEWDRGISDQTVGNGTSTVYGEYVMENGDKFFDLRHAVTQNASGMNTATQVGFITSGTGKFSEIHGVVRSSDRFDGKGFNENQVEIDYSLGK